MSSPQPPNSPDLPDALKGRRQLGPDDEFSFGCHNGLKCFTDCCSDINIMLTPVDVLQLARRLGTTTGEFLHEHTALPITKDLHLPVVTLRMGEESGKRCPFVDEGGCTVYEDRPWSCRMYPVGMGIPPARAGVEPEPVYFLFEDEFCHGHAESVKWTVKSWRDDQKLEERERLEAGFQELVSHPWFIGGRQLDPKRMQMFHMACYDLDTFRRFIFDSTFLDRFEVEKEIIEECRKDDEALLRFAFRWLRYALFGEPTVKPRDGKA
jgi:uncharacterized protein